MFVVETGLRPLRAVDTISPAQKAIHCGKFYLIIFLLLLKIFKDVYFLAFCGHYAQPTKHD